CCFFVFFFQAEDGIRDRNVTGVQTCALPIWGRRGRHPGGPARAARPRGGSASRPPGPAGRRGRRGSGRGPPGTAGRTEPSRRVRSEERRVGKEGRGRGGAE